MSEGPLPPPPGGYQQPGYGQPAYQQPGYQQPPYQQPGYQQPQYQQPGYQQYQQPGYGYPVGPQAAPPALSGIATATMVLLGLSALVAIVAALAFLNRAGLVDDIGNASFSELQDADSRAGGGIAFFFLAYAATGICWVIWQFRHGKAAQALGRNDGLGPGWAIGGWFVPIGNWFLPQSQLLNASKASDTSGQGRPVGIIPAWWAVLVLAQLALLFGQVTRPSDEFGARVDLDAFKTADQAVAGSMFLYAIAAVLGIVTINACTSRMRAAVQARLGR